MQLPDGRARRRWRASVEARQSALDDHSIAAALVAGLLGGYALRETPVPIAEQNGRMVATGAIAGALDTQLASTGAGEDSVRVRLTFRDANGDVCRSFDALSVSGVACREGGGWSIRALFAHDGPPDGTYRMAGTASPAAVAYVDTVIVGEAFDAEAEKRVMQSGWAPR